MATWKKITTEADLTTISASLTTTDQIISSSVATLSGSASDARNELVGSLPTGLSGSASDARNLAALQVSGSFNLLSGSLTVTDVAISSSVAILSGSASDARNLAALQVSGSSTALSGSASDARNLLVTNISGSSTQLIANLSASLTSTDQLISQSVATLSGSASDARNLLAGSISTGLSGSASAARDLAASQVSGSFNLLSGSLTITDVVISSSVATLSGSASTARSLIVADISGSSTQLIANLSASLTTTDQLISQSVALLSGSASDARNELVGALPTGLSGSASDARNLAALQVSGSFNLLSGSLTITDVAISSSVATLSGSASTARDVLATKISGSFTKPLTDSVAFLLDTITDVSESLTTTDQTISSSVATLSGSASDARNLLVTQVSTGLSGSASDARNLAALQVSGSFTNLSASLTTTDQTISSSVAILSGSASSARDKIVDNISGSVDISFNSSNQGEFTATVQGTPITVQISKLGATNDPTFNNLQIDGNTIMEGNLQVNGTKTIVNTTNLLVADQFAVFASGSVAPTDGGLVIQSNVNGDGKAFGYDQSTNRWSLQAALAGTATSFDAPDAFINTVETDTVAPTADPTYGGSTNGEGTIFVNTTTEDIYIYS